MKRGRTTDGVSRRGFLLALAGMCAGGLRRRVRLRAIDHAAIARTAAWAG